MPWRCSLPAMFIRQPRSPARHHIRPAFGDRLGLLLDNGVGDVGIFDAKGAAEAAADVGLGKFGERQPLDRFQQAPRLVADAELTQAGAGIVIGDGAGEGGLDVPDAAHVGEEADEFVDLRGEGLRPFVPFIVLGEEVRVVELQHAGAGTGRRNHIVVGFKSRDHLPGDCRGVLPVARIVGGLAATGLAGGHLDVAAGGFDQFHRGEADARPQQIDKAGDEQPDPGAAIAVFRHLRFRDPFPRSIAGEARRDQLASCVADRPGSQGNHDR